MEFLARNKNQIVDYPTLERAINNIGIGGSCQSLRACVMHLRRKIGGEGTRLVTARGLGYMLEDQDFRDVPSLHCPKAPNII